MSGCANKIKIIAAASFVLLIIYVLAVAEDAYGLNLDYRAEVGICLVVCLLYFWGLAYLLRANSDLAKISTIFLVVFGFIALAAFLLFGFILNPWFWAFLSIPFH